MAWTEDPDNDARQRAAQAPQGPAARPARGPPQLALAVGEDDPRSHASTRSSASSSAATARRSTPAEMLAAAEDPEKSVNKQGMKLIKDKAAAKQGLLLPVARRGSRSRSTARRASAPSSSARPRDADLIADEDPRDGEGFPQGHAVLLRRSRRGGRRASARRRSARHFVVPLERRARRPRRRSSPSTTARATAPDDDATASRSRRTPPWRRIDDDWLYSAETLALKLNTGINNTSLVLAFELPQSKKVLFFAGRRAARQLDLLEGRDVQGRRRDRHRQGPARAHRALQGRPPRQPQRHARGHRRRPSTPTSPGWARARPPRSSPR